MVQVCVVSLCLTHIVLGPSDLTPHAPPLPSPRLPTVLSVAVSVVTVVIVIVCRSSALVEFSSDLIKVPVCVEK